MKKDIRKIFDVNISFTRVIERLLKNQTFNNHNFSSGQDTSSTIWSGAKAPRWKLSRKALYVARKAKPFQNILFSHLSLSLRFFNSYCIFYTLLILPLVNFMSSYCIKFNCVLDRASELNEGNPLLAEHANMPKRRYLRFLQRHLMRMCCQCTCFMNGNDVT